MNRFRDIFCGHVGCRPEDYMREALRRTLYPHAARFGCLARWLCSPLCERLIEDAGSTTSSEGLRDVIRLYEYDVHLCGGFWVRSLRFRVSGQRLLNLHAEVRCQARRQEPPEYVSSVSSVSATNG